MFIFRESYYLERMEPIKKAENEIDKFILDLRNNPGGLLSQAIKISDFFLNDGEIVSTRGRNKRAGKKKL